MAGSQELEDQRKAVRYTNLDDLPTYQAPPGRTMMGGTERVGLIIVLLVIAVVVVAEFIGLRDLLMMVVRLVRRLVA